MPAVSYKVGRKYVEEIPFDRHPFKILSLKPRVSSITGLPLKVFSVIFSFLIEMVHRRSL